MAKKTGLDEYLSQVNQYLTGPVSEKKAALEKVRLFLVDTPGIENMSLSEVLEIVDPPEEVAEQFMAETKARTIISQALSQKRVRIFLIIVILIIVTLLAGYFYDHHTFVNGQEGQGAVTIGSFDPQRDGNADATYF